MRAGIVFPELDLGSSSSLTFDFVSTAFNTCETVITGISGFLCGLFQSSAESRMESIRTAELGKRLAAERRAFDAQINAAMEQNYIRYRENVRRMTKQLELDKARLRKEFEAQALKTKSEATQFAIALNEHLAKNREIYRIFQEQIKTLALWEAEFKQLESDNDLNYIFLKENPEVKNEYFKITEEMRTARVRVQQCLDLMLKDKEN